MAIQFLDTNILVRHMTQDHPEHSRRATGFLEKVESGEIKVYTADTVIFETVFTLERSYHQPKAKIREVFLPIIELPGIILPGKRRFRKVFDLYVNLNLPFADAYHAVVMEHLHLKEIVTFDREFDRVPDVSRIEP